MIFLYLPFFVCGLCGIYGLSYRLPNTIEPLHYSVKLIPNLDNGDFYGEVSIDVKVKTICKSILLHSSTLNITDVYLNQRKENIWYALHPLYEFLEIYYHNTTIPPGNHRIDIRYQGSLLDKSMGFFRASFSGKGGTTYLAVTDFQPTYTRRAFPCFDEPSFKARFQLLLVTPNYTYTALSNMKQIDSFETPEGVVTKFETTCMISPYLIAFAISNYTYGEYTLSSGCQQIPIRVYSPDANSSDTEKPLEYAALSLQFYTNYTKYSYPLHKLDFIEYDRNQSGATENWGLITTKSGILSPQLKIFDYTQIANVITHEVAHFWFGNLVTNNWWNDIWLHESFAVFMSLKAEENILHNNAIKNFPTNYLEDVYSLDQKSSANPIVTYVETPLEINKHFSDITYSKGAAVLRMIEFVLGEEKFRLAVQYYIKHFAFKTVTTSDFIDIVEQFSSNVDLRSFIESYVYQNRYPIVNVEEDQQNDDYVLTQSSCNSSNEDTNTVYKYKWTIPITYITSLQKQEQLIWFQEDMEYLRIPKEGSKWILLNRNEIGLYRVTYNESLWKEFKVQAKEMDALDRRHLLSEAVQLYQSGLISCEIALTYMDELSNLKKIPVRPVWTLLIYAHDDILQYDEKAYRILMDYAQILLKKAGYERSLNIDIIRNEGNNETSANMPTIPEKVSSCITWIKENLYKEVNMTLN